MGLSLESAFRLKGKTDKSIIMGLLFHNDNTDVRKQ